MYIFKELNEENILVLTLLEETITVEESIVVHFGLLQKLIHEIHVILNGKSAVREMHLSHNSVRVRMRKVEVRVRTK